MRRLAIVFSVAALALALLPLSPAAAVSGAAFTTVNENVDGTGHCKNGNPAINCNIYDGKEFVWLSGGPVTAALENGAYFFVVLVPGGQPTPNDGGPKNLSDDFDAYTDRTFTIDGGAIGYSGIHDFSDNKIRLMSYADTTNPGGVYILGVCSTDGGYPVSPSKCKYDAFKVEAGQIPPASDLAIVKDATPSFTRTFHWDISKSAGATEAHIASGGTATFTYTVTVTHDAGIDSDWQVAGTITLVNPNDSDVSGVTVSDAVDNGGSCAVTGGSDVTIAASDFATFAYLCTYASAPTQASGTNTATATWPTQTLGNASELLGSSATFSVGFGFTTPTTTVGESAAITDTLGGGLGTVHSTDASPTSFTYAHDFTADPAGTCTKHDNTATLTTATTTDSASDDVTVCVGADLTLAKTAATTFTRTYKWDISKTVDRHLVKQVGGSATFNYGVTATELGFDDSAWAASGTVTVTNPNDWEALTFDLADAVDNGGSCSITGGGTGLTVNKKGGSGDTLVAGYTCTFPSGASRTNTATATWDTAAYATPSGTASGTAAIAFVTPSAYVRPSINVTDTFNGGTTALWSATATDTAPYTTTTSSYSRTINVPAFGCVNYPNTATIVETGQPATQTVTVCGPAATGALTMGFWQNKNGQAIIASYSGTNCQTLRSWLNGYNPYTDLTATTCSGVQAYVSGLIKVASASGAAMNAMLKAQMLATSLDAFFSDPALGGNRINASAPIGGRSIDLTRICKNIGSCTTFENVTAAFGGATSLSVSQMLSYAASQSSAGGSLWYANVKATQELAKDAFDAINNQVAFAP